MSIAQGAIQRILVQIKVECLDSFLELQPSLDIATDETDKCLYRRQTFAQLVTHRSVTVPQAQNQRVQKI